jgi:6-phosphofructokinase
MSPLFTQDCCLIPESPFYMDGEGGLLQYIEKRLKENKHMVIVVAEGAGQDLIAKSIARSDQQDASGNKLLLDIGLWLTHKIKVCIKNISCHRTQLNSLSCVSLSSASHITTRQLYDTVVCESLNVSINNPSTNSL